MADSNAPIVFFPELLLIVLLSGGIACSIMEYCYTLVIEKKRLPGFDRQVYVLDSF